MGNYNNLVYNLQDKESHSLSAVGVCQYVEKVPLAGGYMTKVKNIVIKKPTERDYDFHCTLQQHHALENKVISYIKNILGDYE